MVITLLAMMALSLSVVAGLFYCMRRNVARRDAQVDELLEEVADGERRKKQAIRDAAKAPEPWERDGDWWKE